MNTYNTIFVTVLGTTIGVTAFIAFQVNSANPGPKQEVAALQPQVASAEITVVESSATPSPTPTPSSTPSVAPTPSAVPTPLLQVATTQPTISPTLTPTSAPQKGYIIVVINELNREEVLNGIHQRTVEMIQQIEPWATYSPYIEVVKVKNTKINLGCIIGEITRCPDEGQIMKIVRNDFGIKEADVVIVAIGKGERSTGPKGVVAVAKSASPGLIAHELGHAAAGLWDEYVYDHEHTPASPKEDCNCFVTKAECEAAIAPYMADPMAGCYQGCTTDTLWRPVYGGIMSDPHSNSYGQFNECTVAKMLEKEIGAKVKGFKPSGQFCARNT